MDEEAFSQSPKATTDPEPSPETTGQTDAETTSHSSQVFDITPDLNISPAKDEVEPDPEIQTPITPPSGISENKPSVDIPSVVIPPVAPQTVAPTQPQIIIPPPSVKPSYHTTLANPPTKTIGILHQAEFEKADASGDLQSAVASILPGNVRKPNPPVVSHVPKPEDQTAYGLKRLRTYETDVADIMSRRHPSMATVAIAESRKNEGQEVLKTTEEKVPSHTLRNILLFLFSLILVGGGLYVAYYLYTNSVIYTSAPSQTTVPQKTIISSIITPDSQVTLPIDNLPAATILARLQNEIAKPLSSEKIKEIIPTENQNGTVVRMSSTDMLGIMSIPAPDILVRSLTASWMLGVYAKSDGGKSVFVIVTNNFFQNTFAGMLQWENVMADDLKQYLYPSNLSPSGIANITGQSTSTLTSTNETRNFGAIRGRFVDRIIKNKDVREFMTNEGQVLFLYSFIDNDRLVITGDEATLYEILSRLEKQDFMR